jgi:hypothetical protein
MALSRHAARTRTVNGICLSKASETGNEIHCRRTNARPSSTRPARNRCIPMPTSRLIPRRNVTGLNSLSLILGTMAVPSPLDLSLVSEQQPQDEAPGGSLGLRTNAMQNRLSLQCWRVRMTPITPARRERTSRPLSSYAKESPDASAIWGILWVSTWPILGDRATHANRPHAAPARDSAALVPSDTDSPAPGGVPNRAPGSVCGESFLHDWTQTTDPDERRTGFDNSNPDPANVTDACDGLTAELTLRASILNALRLSPAHKRDLGVDPTPRQRRGRVQRV